LNYFQLFGLEVQFPLDNKKLSERYQTLQKKAHPDRFAHASNQEQLLAVQKSAMINDAYQTLKTPLKRAEYLLNVRGTEMPNEQASYSDNSFLMRQMELHEMLDDVKSASNTDQAIDEVSEVLDTEYQQLLSEMKQQLAENSLASNSLACDNLRKLKFYQKLHVELDKLEDLLLEQ
jgi:molecular chaperone HscB